MKRIVFLLICFACAAGGFAAKAALENEDIAQFLSDYAAWIATVLIAGLAGLGLVLFLGYLYTRHRLRRLLNAETPLTEAQIVEGLVDMFTAPNGVTNPTPADRQRAALVNAGTWLMRRQATQFYFNVTVTLIGGLIGTATLFLLYEQNQKITLQTDAGITQSVLLEGARRAALASDMAALFADIRQASAAKDPENPEHQCHLDAPYVDCWQVEPFHWEFKPPKEVRRFHLSTDLRARVTAFAQRNTPYRLAVSRGGSLEFETPLRDQINFPDLSPERGQLLETLVLNRIYTGGFDLTAAQLTGVDLRSRDLLGARLGKSNLRDALLTGAHLEGADLSGADLRKVGLARASLARGNLSEANLEGASLSGADLEASNLRGAFLGGVVLGGSFRRGSFKEWVNLKGAILEGAWAWTDDPPVGLTDVAKEVVITICSFNPDQHSRFVKPDDCTAAGQSSEYLLHTASPRPSDAD